VRLAVRHPKRGSPGPFWHLTKYYSVEMFEHLQNRENVEQLL
jgi:hypothetical protein